MDQIEIPNNEMKTTDEMKSGFRAIMCKKEIVENTNNKIADNRRKSTEDV